MKRKLVYVNLLSDNSPQLIDFYTKIVGLDPLDSKEDPAKESWYGFDTGAVPFAIEPMSNRDKYTFDYDTKNPTLIQFMADSLEDLEEWTKSLEDAGVSIGQRVLKKSYGAVTTFSDPDGNLVELLYREGL